MAYRPYQERRRHEAERWDGLLKQLSYELKKTDLDRDPTGRGAVGRTLNQGQVPTGRDRDQLFGRLMREVQKLKQQSADVADAKAQMHEGDFQDLIANYPRDAWDNTVD